MAFVQFTGVSLGFGGRDILVNADIKLKTGSRAALCGVNGSGKSTLMKVMAGIIACDRGERALEKEAAIAYLPQSGLVHRGKTLWDEAKTAFARFDDINSFEKSYILRRLSPNTAAELGLYKAMDLADKSFDKGIPKPVLTAAVMQLKFCTTLLTDKPLIFFIPCGAVKLSVCCETRIMRSTI